MKVAFITRGPFGVLGGGASYMLPTELSKDHDVLVCSPHNPKSKEKIVHKNKSVRVQNTFGSNKKKMLLNTFHHLKEFNPDIVHIFQNPNCLFYLNNLQSAFPNTKWVLDFRTQIISQDKVHQRSLRRRFFFAHLMVDHIFSQSVHTMSSSLPVRLKSFTELPIGLDLNSIRTRKHTDIRRKITKFVFIGMLAKQRKLGLLLRAFAIYVQEHDATATLDVFGGGDDLENLKNVVEKLNCPNISLLGSVEQEVLGENMCNYDAGFAYVPYEGYMWAPSLKSLEYAAAGIPILASKTNGHIDYQKRFGFDFNYFDNTEASIVDAICNIVRIQDTAEQCEENSKAVIRFDWKSIVVSDILPVYRRILKQESQ